MPKDKDEDAMENVFKLTILVPLIRYLEVFTSTSHNLGPDEFLKAIYDPEKPRSTNYSKIVGNPDCHSIDPPKIFPEELQIPPEHLQKPIAQLFFEIIRLRPFMVNVIHEFRKRGNRRDVANISQFIVIAYVLIYRSSVDLINDAVDCIVSFDVSKILALLSFLLTPELPSWFYIAGCDIFDVDFVEQRILNPFVKALPVIQTIYTNLRRTRRRKSNVRKVTIPMQMNVLNHPKKLPARPACTPEKVVPIPVQPVPRTLYESPKIKLKIAKLREEHRAQATRRLEDSNAKAPACFRTEKSKRYQRILEEVAEAKNKNYHSIVANKIPKFKNVPVKETVTTILREGARIANGEVKEVEKLKQLMKGSFDPAELQRMEEEMRQCEREENARKIEEKHLAGLISYEESLLAKQQLIDEAKEQGDRVRSEREELNAKLEKFRLEEMAKLKRMVEKCHDAEQAAKDSYAFMMDEKRQKAAEVAEESRRIKLSLIEQKEEELKRKLQLIQEIKIVQSMQSLRVKEFDPTETSKLGLMCEMSLAELKERLFLVKREWHDELIARREAVKERRQRQRDFVEGVQKTINEHRLTKQSFPAPAVPLQSNHSKILQTPELEALRRKLEERRMTRLRKMNHTIANVVSSKSQLSANSSH